MTNTKTEQLSNDKIFPTKVILLAIICTVAAKNKVFTRKPNLI